MGTGRAYRLDQISHGSAHRKALLRHHDLAYEGLHIVLAQRRVVGIGQLLLQAVGEAVGTYYTAVRSAGGEHYDGTGSPN